MIILALLAPMGRSLGLSNISLCVLCILRVFGMREDESMMMVLNAVVFG